MAFVLTFSHPSGGSLAKNLLMCGEVPSLGGSGDDPVLPPASHIIILFECCDEIIFG